MQKSREGMTPNSGRVKRRLRKLGLTDEERWGEPDEEGNDPRDPEAFQEVWEQDHRNDRFAICSPVHSSTKPFKRLAHKALRRAYREELRLAMVSRPELLNDFDPYRRLRSKWVRFEYKIS